jgi:hypothetical protein
MAATEKVMSDIHDQRRARLIRENATRQAAKLYFQEQRRAGVDRAIGRGGSDWADRADALDQTARARAAERFAKDKRFSDLDFEELLKNNKVHDRLQDRLTDRGLKDRARRGDIQDRLAQGVGTGADVENSMRDPNRRDMGPPPELPTSNQQAVPTPGREQVYSPETMQQDDMQRTALMQNIEQGNAMGVRGSFGAGARPEMTGQATPPLEGPPRDAAYPGYSEGTAQPTQAPLGQRGKPFAPPPPPGANLAPRRDKMAIEGVMAKKKKEDEDVFAAFSHIEDTKQLVQAASEARWAQSASRMSQLAQALGIQSFNPGAFAASYDPTGGSPEGVARV